MLGVSSSTTFAKDAVELLCLQLGVGQLQDGGVDQAGGQGEGGDLGHVRVVHDQPAQVGVVL